MRRGGLLLQLGGAVLRPVQVSRLQLWQGLVRRYSAVRRKAICRWVLCIEFVNGKHCQRTCTNVSTFPNSGESSCVGRRRYVNFYSLVSAAERDGRQGLELTVE